MRARSARDHGAAPAGLAMRPAMAREDGACTTLDGVDDRASELTNEARIALDLLQEEGAASVDGLRAAGVTMPAQALYALQLAGWPVVRRGSTWRLTDPNAPVPPKPAPIPRVRRVVREG